MRAPEHTIRAAAAPRGRAAPPVHRRVVLAFGLLAVLLAPSTMAQDADPLADLDAFLNMSLEELTAVQVTVTSVSKKPQDPFKTAAAVYVLDAEQIRRSGLQTIPELLRLVPGVHVARFDSSLWDVGVRGFNAGHSNKLLVLIDGRSVYDPMFGGVFWEVQDTLVENIERIEVIRGPGASIWGANAVNGVINIITKKASAGDSLASVAVGNEQEYITQGQVAGALQDDNGAWRAWVRGKSDDSTYSATRGRHGGNSWWHQRAGFRADWEPNLTDAVTVQGDIYRTRLRYFAWQVDPVAGDFIVHNTARASGGNVLGRWTRAISDDESVTVQAYVDRTERENRFREEDRTTYDVQIDHHIRLNDTHDVVWGAGYRQSQGHHGNTGQFMLTPRSRDLIFGNLYFQDEITVIPDLFTVTLGSKFEKNTYTGWETQPTARFTLTPDDDNTVWGAFSQAVRTPTPIERDGYIPIIGFPGGGFTPGNDLVLAFAPGRDFDVEKLKAYELGYRTQFDNGVVVDIATYYHDYDNLATEEDGAIVTQGTLDIFPLIASNKMEGVVKGVELAVDVPVSDTWDVHTSWTHTKVDFNVDNDSTDPFAEGSEDNEPDNLFHFRSHHQVDDQWDVDWLLYYADSLRARDVRSWWRGDIRVGYRPDETTEYSAGVQNLFHVHEQETDGQRMELAWYLKALKRF